jgi:hypothetical protein
MAKPARIRAALNWLKLPLRPVNLLRSGADKGNVRGSKR